MQLSPKLVRFLMVLAILAGGVLLFAGYFYTQFTADVDIGAFERPTRYDAKEVRRKMKLLEDSRTNTVRGFIRLAEVELNSYLHERYGGTNATAARTAGLQRCRIDLTETNLTLICWIQKPWMGRSWNLVWQRSASLKPTASGWDLEPQDMYVGRVRIPHAHWPKVEEALGTVDAAFVEDLRWLKAAPSIGLVPAEVTKRPELRIYNHAESPPAATPAK